MYFWGLNTARINDGEMWTLFAEYTISSFLFVRNFIEEDFCMFCV